MSEKNIGKNVEKKRLPHWHKQHKHKGTNPTQFRYNNISGHFSEIDFEIK